MAEAVSMEARPRLPRGVRLVHNEAHGGWVLLAPERDVPLGGRVY